MSSKIFYIVAKSTTEMNLIWHNLEFQKWSWQKLLKSGLQYPQKTKRFQISSLKFRGRCSLIEFFLCGISSLGKYIWKPVFRQGNPILKPVFRQKKFLIKPVFRQRKFLIKPVFRQGTEKKTIKPRPDGKWGSGSEWNRLNQLSNALYLFQQRIT